MPALEHFCGRAEEIFETTQPMRNTVSLIGIRADELPWLRLLLALLRHTDAGVAELARQALLYLADAAGREAPGCNPADPPPALFSGTIDQPG
ncbi:MAG TPA: hypothetical protein VKX45_02895 [Bryobacteraceae bacterium]|nr:hypothetical protein [Bryobacteraceae bacterium]